MIPIDSTGPRINAKQMAARIAKGDAAHAKHLQDCLQPPKNPAVCTWPTADLPKRPPGQKV